MKAKIGQFRMSPGYYYYIYAHDTLRDIFDIYEYHVLSQVMRRVTNISRMGLEQWGTCEYDQAPYKFHKLITSQKINSLEASLCINEAVIAPFEACKHVKGKTPLTNSKNQLCIICKICGADLEVIK